MFTRGVIVLNEQAFPDILRFVLKLIIPCLSDAAGTILVVLCDICSCLCADRSFSLGQG